LVLHAKIGVADSALPMVIVKSTNVINRNVVLILMLYLGYAKSIRLAYSVKRLNESSSNVLT